MTIYEGISGKKVLITGAAGGIGQEMARVLAERGAIVLLTDVVEQRLQEVRESLGAAAIARSADLTDPEAVDALFAWADDECEGVDHLINNAGVLSQAKIENFPDEDWDRVISVNLTSVYRCTKAYARARIARGGGGAIVNIASMAYKGMTQQIAYSSSKGGVVSMTRSTAMELARHGVRANAIAPGMIETPMIAVENSQRDPLREKMLPQIPLRRYGHPREIACVAAFLLSNDASYLTGEIVHVSGGARL